MLHSGICIHDPQYDGYWDCIIIEPGPIEHGAHSFKEDGSKQYRIATGWDGNACWVCDTCVSTPGYFLDYLLFRLRELTEINEV